MLACPGWRRRTIAVVLVPWEPRSSCPLLMIRITKFSEQRSNLASMGSYIFSTDLLLERLLREDAELVSSLLGGDIIPTLLCVKRLFNIALASGVMARYYCKLSWFSMDLSGSELSLTSSRTSSLSCLILPAPAYIGVDDCLVSGCQIFGYSPLFHRCW